MSIVSTSLPVTPLLPLASDCDGNRLFVKREDLLPFSFGGNKARKARLFFAELQEQGCDCVVTYGSGSSNHCRVVANYAVALGIPCYVVSPCETAEVTFNSKLVELFGAAVTVVPVAEVHDTIEKKLQQLRDKRHRPYFIAGGGHGNLGTQAYVDCYHEICDFERNNNLHFDYIFHASGTGTTQAGLICGQLLQNDKRKIIGISIARKCPRGRDVVLDSVRDYLNANACVIEEELLQQTTHFIDDYTGNGYGACQAAIIDTIRETMTCYGLPLDVTYTGKAFNGMRDYLKKHSISGKNILFIHTGGTPLFFNAVAKFQES